MTKKEKSAFPSAPLVFGIRLDNLTLEEAADKVAEFAREGRGRTVFFVNAHCVNVAFSDPDYMELLQKADLVLPDGIGIRLAGLILKQKIRDNVNGTDLFPVLCERLAQASSSVFLLGALPGLAERVAMWIERKHPGLLVAGTYHGYFGPEEEEMVVERIASSRAQVLLVAMGVPKQEKWIARNIRKCGVGVALGVGGLFDFYSGRIPRAPKWMRQVGMEWLFRLAMEPRRLWKRYLIGNAVFMARLARARLAMGLPSKG